MCNIRWWLDMSLTLLLRVHAVGGLRYLFDDDLPSRDLWWERLTLFVGPRLRACIPHLKGLKVRDYRERPAEFPGSFRKAARCKQIRSRRMREAPGTRTVLFRLGCRKFLAWNRAEQSGATDDEQVFNSSTPPPLGCEFAFRGENHSSTFYVDPACLLSLTSRFRMRFLHSNVVQGNDGWKIVRDICDNIILCALFYGNIAFWENEF